MRSSPFETRRSATVGLLVANAVAFLLECVRYSYPPRFPLGDYFALSWYGLTHGYVWQLVTFQFLHGGLLHLLFNCWAIYIFGKEVEEALGVKKFLTLYFTSGIIGGLVQALAGGLAVRFGNPTWITHLAAPTVGASAGAFGLLAAFAMMFPERRLMLLLFFVLPVSLRAKFLLLFSGLLALFGLLFPAGNMADAAHLGGMLTGILFVRYALNWDWHWPKLRRSKRQVPLRLVKVGSGGSGLWARAKSSRADDDLPPDEFLSKEVDPILDKISAHGIQSLTDRERRILEVARQKMGRR